MPKRITGRVEVVVNGNTLLNKEGATAIGIGESGKPAMERQPVYGDAGLHGFTEAPIEASCEVTLTDREDQSLGDLAVLDGNATIIFKATLGGKVYTMNDAFCSKNFTVTAGQGEVSGVKFFGSYWTESTS